MNFPKTPWRLIQTPAASGAWNMAVDEAILGAIGRNEVLPTLRLYAWSPACLSLGHAQPVTDILPEVLRSHGWDLVRRPTGGRAILHADELTYSVVGPPDEPRLAKDILHSYLILSQALLRALHILDIPAQAEDHVVQNINPGSGQPNQLHNPVCFEVPSHYEITVNGKKLVGSAQARRREGVLQHGTFPLYGDLTRIIHVLQFPGEDDRLRAKERLLERAITAEAVLGRPLSWGDAATAFIEAFQDVLNLELRLEDLSNAERIHAQELVAEKYAHPQWTGRL